MKSNTRIHCAVTPEFYAEVVAAAIDLRMSPSEFMRLSMIHALKERPVAAFAQSSGVRKGRPPRRGASA
ncbi:hypothetical protein [Burkholderia sp. MSMB2157WGS]|uniref:hypothetical protein n=1 Tax=Burkholderia sp. MSMB2157WGS TaxID=1637928 RepID=UPI000AC737EE|nr:hypothetical protein [Burkholderia sp. MSMB2157WGS]